ncbi:MAG: hypothetical protein ABI175_30870, partial [Polyangiales bacterium]
MRFPSLTTVAPSLAFCLGLSFLAACGSADASAFEDPGGTADSGGTSEDSSVSGDSSTTTDAEGKDAKPRDTDGPP